MKYLIQKFRQSSIVFEKPGCLSKKLKTLTSCNYHRVYFFLLKLRTRTFPIYQCLQKCTWDFVVVVVAVFSLDELFAKIKKT